jgi:hypothetical protein
MKIKLDFEISIRHSFGKSILSENLRDHEWSRYIVYTKEGDIVFFEGFIPLLK